MDGLERLLAIEDIKLLRAKYCRSIDSHDFDRLRTYVTDFQAGTWPSSSLSNTPGSESSSCQ